MDGALLVLVMTTGLFALSVASGMLGLGVAFAAVPFLGFFLPDLVHQVQPLSLFLNGVTAMFAAAGFARSNLVAWRPALLLTAVASFCAPVGSGHLTDVALGPVPGGRGVPRVAHVPAHPR